MNAKKLRANLMLLLTAMIWGTAFVAQSQGMDFIGPFTFNAARSLVGALALVPVGMLLKRLGMRGGENSPAGGKPSRASGERVEADARASRRTLWIGGAACGVALFVASSLQQIGLTMTTPGKAGFITALYIVLVPLLRLFTGKRLALRVWLAVALCAVGLYLLCITEGFSVSTGDLCVLACALCFSFHILIIDRFSPRVDGVRLSCIQFLVAGLLSVPFALALEKPTLAALWRTAGPVLYAGVLSSGVGYTLQIIAQKDTDPTVASLLMSLESVFAVIAGLVVLHQVPAAREWMGCGLMFAGILLSQLPTRSQGKINIPQNLMKKG